MPQSLLSLAPLKVSFALGEEKGQGSGCRLPNLRPLRAGRAEQRCGKPPAPGGNVPVSPELRSGHFKLTFVWLKKGSISAILCG